MGTPKSTSIATTIDTPTDLFPHLGMKVPLNYTALEQCVVQRLCNQDAHRTMTSEDAVGDRALRIPQKGSLTGKWRVLLITGRKPESTEIDGLGWKNFAHRMWCSLRI